MGLRPVTVLMCGHILMLLCEVSKANSIYFIGSFVFPMQIWLMFKLDLWVRYADLLGLKVTSPWAVLITVTLSTTEHFFSCKCLPTFKPITRWGSREPPYILNQNISPIYSALRKYSYTPNFFKCCCLMLNCFKLLFSTSIYTLMVKQKIIMIFNIFANLLQIKNLNDSIA